MIRRAWPLALALAALVGCSEQPPMTENGTPINGVAPGKGGSGGGPAGDMSSQGYPGMTPPKSSDPNSKPEAPKDGAEAPKDGAEPAKPEAAATVNLSEEEITNIKLLPAEDAALALQQKVCPISDGHLGEAGMGKPIKVEADGKTAFLCCNGCKKAFEKDPKAALAKLGLDK